MIQVPRFKRGEVPRAADFAALVSAVRELLTAQGVSGRVYQRQPARYYFVPAGSSVARLKADGTAEALVAEWLWQCGEYVRLLPGAAVEGLDEALERAGERGAATGLHGSLWLTHHGEGSLWRLEATGVGYTAAAWLEQAVNDDGTLDAELLHGGAFAGCVLGVENVLHQRQQRVDMWPQPQRPLLVWRQLLDVPPEVSGSGCLLPCEDLRQVLAWAYGGYYPGNDYMADFVTVWHCWTARLDMWGQLHFGAVNLGTE